MYQPPSTLDERSLYRRSTFQVAVLLFLSSGLYVFWWSYYIRRSAAALLEERDSPVWRSLGLLIPLVNLFLIYELFEKIKVASLRAGLRPPQAFPAWGILGVVVLVVCGGLPVPYAALAMLYFIPFAMAHSYFAHAELLLAPHKALPAAFSIVEVFVVIAGVGWRSLLMFVYTFEIHHSDIQFVANAWFGWAVLLACLAALVQFYRQSHHLVEQSFQTA